LKIGEKPIIEHNLLQLIKYGIDDFWISLNYLGEQLVKFLGDGSKYGVQINYVWEDRPLGTIGAISQISDLQHDHVLITNSDILTNLNYEEFYLDFIANDADMSVVTIPYEVNIPYAVLETSNNLVRSFKEKPTYTYYSNGGIYLVKRSLLTLIPKDTFFNTTDLMEKLLHNGGKLISYPMRQYWLDIGKPEDFNRAQKDIKYLNI
jgi:NDP-sugar pyrophosphorylase family protein